MAKVKFRSPIQSIHGRLGNIIFYTVNGINYARSYSIPENPRTEAQQKNRVNFADAVKLWQGLTDAEKAKYNRMAIGKPLSGYNLFISMKMKNISPEVLNVQERVLVKECCIYTSYIQAVTSVSAPEGLFLNKEYRFNGAGSCRPTLKKPPGRIFRAA
ncbi:MAG TPA: DUF6266 family protein [Spirochaetota bacterium]|nr:DUF6266 family protein [Spirochaetota bacterium]